MLNGNKSKVATRLPYIGCVVILAALIFLIFWRTELSAPVLHINVSGFSGTQSQLFYKQIDGAYAESLKKVSLIDADMQEFSFELNEYDKRLRWDPLENRGSFYVKKVWLQFMGFQLNIPLDKLTPNFQIQKINTDEKGAFFKEDEQANDASIIISVDAGHIRNVRMLLSVMVSALVTMVIIFWIFYSKNIIGFLQRPNIIILRLNDFLKKENFTSKEFFFLLSISIFLSLIQLTHFSISIDDEIGAYRTNSEVWIADGRWTAYLVEKFLFPQPVLPYAPNLFFCLCLAISYMFITRAHGLVCNWRSYLAFVVFSSYPIWWFIGEFYSNLPSAGVGVLCLSVSVFLLFREKNYSLIPSASELPRLFASSVLMALAVGAYQSLTMMHMALGFGVILFRYLNIPPNADEGFKVVWARVSRYCIVFVVGLIVYVMINKFAQFLYPYKRGYIDSFLRLDQLLSNPFQICTLVVIEMWKIYTGSIERFGVSISASGCVLALAFLLACTGKKLKELAVICPLFLAVLLAPFLLHFVTGALYLPMRSLLAVSYVTWLAAIIVMRQTGVVLVSTQILIAFLCLQIVSTNSQYAASTILARDHDRMMAEQLYNRLSELDPKFDRSKNILIDVYGKKSLANHYPSPPTSTMSASFFDWDDGNHKRMLQYMRLIGFSNVYPVGDNVRQNLISKFQKMPVWPASGSVIYDEGIYLVKLSERPDPGHLIVK